MKKLIVYTVSNGQESWKNAINKEEALRYFNAQVDSSIACGWDPSDIILVTNFDYSYNGVSAYNKPELFMHQVGCCISKYIGLKWALETFSENIWVNDHDNFQIQPFDVNEVNQILNKYLVYGCGGMHPLPEISSEEFRWSDQSIFFNPKSLDVVESFVSSQIDLPRDSGSGFLAALYFYERIKDQMKIVHNNQYKFKFNIMNGDLGVWKIRLARLKRHNTTPVVIHGKLNSQDFIDAKTYLQADSLIRT